MYLHEKKYASGQNEDLLLRKGPGKDWFEAYSKHQLYNNPEVQVCVKSDIQ